MVNNQQVVVRGHVLENVRGHVSGFLDTTEFCVCQIKFYILNNTRRCGGFYHVQNLVD